MSASFLVACEQRAADATHAAPAAPEPPLIDLESARNVAAWTTLRSLLLGVGHRYHRRLNFLCLLVLLVFLIILAMLLLLALQALPSPFCPLAFFDVERLDAYEGQRTAQGAGSFLLSGLLLRLCFTLRRWS